MLDDFEVVPQEADDGDMWDVEGENEDEIKQAKIKSMWFHCLHRATELTISPEHGLTTAEAVTLAQQLVNREKTRTELVNEGFNRYSLNSKDDLPTWFLDDESKHYKANVPVTKEAVAALRAKMRALDARPIKKIAEAKARKKYRAAQRLDKAMKKAEGVNETSDMTEREKAKQIEKLMAKGMSTKVTRKEVKVVVAKGAHKGLKGRPKGVKGRYLMVDSRMKKEVCFIDWTIMLTRHTDPLLLSSGRRNGRIRRTRSGHIKEILSRLCLMAGLKSPLYVMDVWLVFILHDYS